MEDYDHLTPIFSIIFILGSAIEFQVGQWDLNVFFFNGKFFICLWIFRRSETFLPQRLLKLFWIFVVDAWKSYLWIHLSFCLFDSKNVGNIVQTIKTHILDAFLSPHWSRSDTLPKFLERCLPLYLCMFAKFDPDWSGFAGNILEKLLFGSKSNYNIANQLTTKTCRSA